MNRPRVGPDLSRLNSQGRGVFRFFVGWFAFVALLALTIVGVTIWAVIRLVLKFT